MNLNMVSEVYRMRSGLQYHVSLLLQEEQVMIKERDQPEAPSWVWCMK